jgi:hypothetical protein
LEIVDVEGAGIERDQVVQARGGAAGFATDDDRPPCTVALPGEGSCWRWPNRWQLAGGADGDVERLVPPA